MEKLTIVHQLEKTTVTRVETLNTATETSLKATDDSIEPKTSRRKDDGSLEFRVHQSRQQPKSEEEEARLAAKYAEMKLEDRAYQILLDLGMIDINDGNSDDVLLHQEVNTIVLDMETDTDDTSVSTNGVIIPSSTHDENTFNTNDDERLGKKEAANFASASNERSRRHRFVRPIRRMIEKARQKFLPRKESSYFDDSILKHIREARRQPKTPKEEALLAEKYKSMDLEDRAYAILSDLYMI